MVANDNLPSPFRNLPMAPHQCLVDEKKFVKLEVYVDNKLVPFENADMNFESVYIITWYIQYYVALVKYRIFAQITVTLEFAFY